MNTNSSKPVNLAKLSPPRIRNVLLRERLFDRLEALEEYPVIWVSAPAGSGKTVLAASYLQQHKQNSIWYQIDEGDSEPAAFFAMLDHALQGLGDNRVVDMPVFAPEYNQGIAAFARNYSRNLYLNLGEGGVLVLDNFQDLAMHADTHQVIRQFISEIPPGINLMILSRSEPIQDYLRFRANGSIAILDWQDIALTEQESEQLCQARLPIKTPEKGAGIASELHQFTRGWAAGMVLLLEQSGQMDIPYDFARQDNHGLIFDYFAGEIFQNESQDTREFLMKTALLPFFTVQMAESLTRNNEAATILQNLTQRNYFTYRSASTADAYEYHPLFREFLLSRLETFFNVRELCNIQVIAGDQLLDLGWLSEAAALYRQAKEWDKLVTLVKQRGAELIRQGRHLLLRGWLQSFPIEFLDKDPWMEYWLAMSLQPVSTRDSRNHFVRAFENFNRLGISQGQMLAWAGMIETYVHDLASFTELDEWIPVMETLYQQEQASLDAAVNARVSIAMFSALMYRQPDHKQIADWEERVREVIFNTPRTTQRLSLGSQLLLYYTVWTGEMPKAKVLRQVLQQSIRPDEMDPMSKIMWHATDATFLWKSGDAAASIKAVKQGLEVANTFDMHVFDILLLASGVYASCMQHKFDQAGKYLRQMEVRLNRNRLVDVVHYHYLAACLALVKGELGMAHEYAETALEAAHKSGALYPESLARLILSLSLIRQGKLNEVVFHLSRIVDLAERIQSHSLRYLNRLVASEAAFSCEEVERGINFLKEAYDSERDLGKVYHGYWWDMRLADNCVKALEHGHDADFTRQMARRHHLIPTAAPLHLDNWEWPVRIYTLGRFSITRYGESLPVTAKSSKKPLELLKVLIAQGGRQVSQDTLIEILWPDSEGDAAVQSLYTTTHRLRKLVSDDGVLMQDGRLTLDARYIWVDNQAFLRLAGRLQELLTAQGEQDRDSIQRLGEQFFHLYQGDFFGPGENHFAYASMKEKLHLRFLKLTESLGSYWLLLGETERCIDCYERALEIDPVAEEFYQGLMSTYCDVGRDGDAIVLFQRCRKNLSNILGISPSQATLKIFKSIQQ